MALSFGVGSASAPALASGFAVRENALGSMGMAFAGAGSRASDASTAFSNPAGMTELNGQHVLTGAALVVPHIWYEGDAAVGGTPITGGDGGNGGEYGLIPNFHAVFDLGARTRAGLSITSPFGNSLKYKTNFYGRYATGGLETSALSTDINPSVAFAVNDMLSLGAGVSFQRYQSTVANAINQTALAGGARPDGYVRLRADDWSVGFNLGALLKLSRDTKVGFTYRSELNHNIKGGLEFDNIDATANTNVGGILVSQPASVAIHLPGTAGLSVTHKVNPRLSLSADAQWTNWSRFQRTDVVGTQGTTIPVNQAYKDSWMFAVGGEYRLDDGWTVRGGLALDQTPVQNGYRTVGVPDNDRYIVSVGAERKLGPKSSVEFSFAHQFAQDANMTGSVNGTDAFQTTSMRGHYSLGLTYFGIGYKRTF